MATQAQIDELFEKMAEEREALLAAPAEVDEEQAEVQPPEGEGEEGWSVKEQLTHLAGMDRSYRQWVIRALAEERPDTSDGKTPNVPLDVPQEQAHSADLPTLIAQMSAERAETLELARGIEAEQYERTAFVPDARVAVIPPRDASAPGSMGKNRPVSRRYSLSCLRRTPGWIRQSRSSAFTSRISSIRVTSMETPPCSAWTCPSSEVPVPNGIMGQRCFAHRRTIRATSSVLSGKTTMSGGAARW